MERRYQQCIRCVMDTSDPYIEFDQYGICNHCRNYEILIQKFRLPESQKKDCLQSLVEAIRNDGRGKEYDCIIGVSGGIDSTYLAYYVKKMGLRPLAVHMDNGWDSELAVGNIEKTLKSLNIDLYTYVLDWEEFRDLQMSFLQASVPDGEIPSDHAISATLYHAADSRGISYILLGTNLVTEAILPSSWTYGVRDWRYIHSVQKRYGTKKIKTFPHYSLIKMAYYTFLRNIKVIPFLDYISYSQHKAMFILEKELGWCAYGGKHYESIYTRFFQGYVLPRKFNIDKRKAHYSTMIMSKLMHRDQALKKLITIPYAGYVLEEDMEYVLKKFDINEEEFKRIMALPVQTHRNFSTYLPIIEQVKDLGFKPFLSRIGLWPGV